MTRIDLFTYVLILLAVALMALALEPAIAGGALGHL